MKRKSKQQFKNQLELVRNRKLIVRKQVASLLGHKTTDQISRYERGTNVPSLKAALKLGIIYKIPVRVLLDGYFEACRNEIKRQEEGLAKSKGLVSSKDRGYRNDETDFCTIAEKLKLEHVRPTELDKAYSHSAELIRRRAEKLGHI